jgi:hypothetical protein
MAEVEALYARVLEMPDVRAERRALTELAGAGLRLAELAHDVADGRTPCLGHSVQRVPRPRRASRTGPRRGTRTKLERRIARVESTTEWIITRTSGH